MRPLLARLLELPPDEHTGFLREACGRDTTLARTVRRLYAEERDDAGFLETGIATATTRALVPGDAVGPYRLVRELGRGGMGAVWLAEREGEFRREVALKLVKLGMDTEEVVRRFHRERQLLADLDHPGIVRLLDGGATETGRPYLVLELVDGVPLDQHCRERALDVDARLALFADVCEAVAAAHALGVVHRDLKPSNVLVTDDGTAKVLDFGIAKVLVDEGPELSLLTRTGERLLTPRYAAPEQVRGEPCTPATDVYALGVLLYELLTDRPPYDVETATLREIETAVCEETPRRPSALTGGTLRRRLAGDLDTIALRALAKEPARRYRDAAHLARDVRRHLAHEPIEARPDSGLYRAAKFVRRNRLVVASAAAVFLALAVGLVVATVQYAKAEARAEDALWEAYVAGVRTAYADLEAGRHPQTQGGYHLPQIGWEARHLAARSDQSERELARVTPKSPLALDARGATLAARDGDAVLLLDTDSGAVVRRLRLDARPFAIALSPNGELLTSGDRDAVRVHDVADGTVLASWTSPRNVEYVAFHPDGRRVVSYSTRGPVLLHDLDRPDEVRTLLDAPGRLFSWALSPAGDLLAAGGREGRVYVARVERPDDIRLLDFSGGADTSFSLAFSRTGRYLAAAADFRRVRAWDLERGVPVTLPRWNADPTHWVAFRNDRDELLTAGVSVRSVDLASGATRALLGTRASVGALVVDPLEPRFFTSGRDGRVLVWNADAAQVPRHAFGAWGRAVAVSPDGARYAIAFRLERPFGQTGSRYGTVSLRVCETATGRVLAERDDSPAFFDAHWTTDGERLIAVDVEHRVRVLDGRTLHDVRELPPNATTCIALSGDGSTLAAGTEDGRVVLVSTSTGTVQAQADTGFERAVRLAAHPDGRRVAVAGRPSGLTLLDPRGGEALKLKEPSESGDGAPAISLAISPDGRWIAAGSNTVLRVWSAATGEQALSVPCPMSRAVAFSPDSGRLLVAHNASLRVYDTARWTLILTLRDAIHNIEDLDFAPDETLLSVDEGGDVRIWGAAPAPRESVR